MSENKTLGEQLKEKERLKSIATNKKRKAIKIKVSNLVINENAIDPVGDIDQLGRNIIANGLLTPISVAKLGKNKYYVIDGIRRVKAMRLYGISGTVSCYIVGEDLPEFDIQAYALAANMNNRGAASCLVASYSKMLLQGVIDGNRGDSDLVESLVTMTGLTPAQAKKYLNVVSEGYDNVINSLMDGTLALQNAEVIVAAAHDEASQNSLVELFKETPRHGGRMALKDAIKKDPEAFVNCGNRKEAVKKVSSSARVDSAIESVEKGLKVLIREKDISPAKLANVVRLYNHMANTHLKGTLAVKTYQRKFTVSALNEGTSS